MNLENLKGKLNNERSLLITDIDLDGHGSRIICDYLFPKMEKIVSKRNETDKNVQIAIKSNKYDTIIMTDCSLKEENTIELINKFCNKQFNKTFIFLDHHATNLWFNSQDWAVVKTQIDNTKTCGTELFYYYLINMLDIDDRKYLQKTFGNFVEKVRRYDTWDWTILKDEEAANINTLFWNKGYNKFYKDIISAIESSSVNNGSLLTNEDELICETLDKHQSDYIKNKKNKLKKCTWDDEHPNLVAGVLFSESYGSMLGNTVCKEREDIDYCMMINIDDMTVELRSTKENVDVSEIAKRHGGGGHPRASGFPLTDEFLRFIIEFLF